MEAYRLKLISLPDETLLIYTDGGWTKPGTDQEEECGWGYSVRIQYKKPPHDKVDDGTYHAKQISDEARCIRILPEIIPCKKRVFYFKMQWQVLGIRWF